MHLPGRKPQSARIHRDLSLTGVIFLGIALLMNYEMRLPGESAALIGKLICSPLFTMFGALAWLVPIIFALIGIILICEASDPSIITAMSMAAFCYLLLFAAALDIGTFGHLLSSTMTALVGELKPQLIAGLLAILTFSMTGISVRRTAAKVWHIAWNWRLPHHSALFERMPKEVGASPKADPSIPIALPAKPFAHSAGAVIDANYIVAPTERAMRQQVKHSEYHLPDISIFNRPPIHRPSLEGHEQKIVDALASFGVVASVVHKEVGPSITRYELVPGKGVQVSKIAGRADDIKLALAAQSVRIEAPVPGKSVVGIEVPNKFPSLVTIREILESLPKNAALPFALGKDITGKPISADLHDMPHLLVAGATGAGKSVCLNNIIASLLVTCTPDRVQMLMIDPKRVELSVYNGIPHLARPVITDVQQAAGALLEMAREMDARYKLFEAAAVRSLEEYNARHLGTPLPYIVIVIDELADLMWNAQKTVEPVIDRLARLARATGIHLVVATQRPSADVITGLITANIPSRIAFKVSKQVNSRIILDAGGAELLIGKGDMLFASMESDKHVRIQGALITGEEVAKLVNFWKRQGPPGNRVTIDTVAMERVEASASYDPLTREAAEFVIDIGYASVAGIQTRFAIGHPRASKLAKNLEDLGIIGPHVGKKPRRVLVTLEELADLIGGENELCSAA
jgi:DNA segregation ATPase FtsK/SpoIIIE-like protein